MSDTQSLPPGHDRQQELRQLRWQAATMTRIVDSTNRGEMLRVVCDSIATKLPSPEVQIWTRSPDGRPPILATKSNVHAGSAAGDPAVRVDAATIATWIETGKMLNASPVAVFPLIAEQNHCGVLVVATESMLDEQTTSIIGSFAKMIARDIDRQQMLRRNSELDARFESMIRQIKDYAVFMTDAEGVATTWNQGVQNVLGYSQDEFLGINVLKTIFTEEAIADNVAEWEFRTAAESGSCTDDRWMKRRDGTTFWASGITSSFTDDDGNVIGFSKVLRDLTHRKDADDAIYSLNEKLTAADRRKTHFLATLAHELRNPLSPITSALEIMEGEEISADEIETLRVMIGRQVTQMVRLVDDLLDISRISRGTIELRRCQCRLQPIIQQAIETAQPFIVDSNHHMEINVSDQPIYLHADPTRVAQIVTNILNNAAKYTSEKGVLKLDVGPIPNGVRIVVTDNGIGIEAEKIDSIFDMFSQADVPLERGKAGLGIGLSLVRTLVELHGGTIEVASKGRGFGTVVTVCLPAIHVEHVDREADLADRFVDHQHIDKSDADADCVAPHSKRVMIVDDVFAITYTLTRLIGKLGHEVTGVGDAEEALRTMTSFKPEIIFSDISMPGMNGYEFATAVRKRFGKRIVMVAMTGFGQQSDRQRAIDAGFNHHMIKPPDAKILAKFFRSLSAS